MYAVTGFSVIDPPNERDGKIKSASGPQEDLMWGQSTEVTV